MVARQVHLAGGNQEVPVNQLYDAIGQIGREVRAVVAAPIFPEAPRDIDPGIGLRKSQLDVGVSLVVAKQNVEARFVLLNQVVFER